MNASRKPNTCKFNENLIRSERVSMLRILPFSSEQRFYLLKLNSE